MLLIYLLFHLYPWMLFLWGHTEAPQNQPHLGAKLNCKGVVPSSDSALLRELVPLFWPAGMWLSTLDWLKTLHVPFSMAFLTIP